MQKGSHLPLVRTIQAGIFLSFDRRRNQLADPICQASDRYNIHFPTVWPDRIKCLNAGGCTIPFKGPERRSKHEQRENSHCWRRCCPCYASLISAQKIRITGRSSSCIRRGSNRVSTESCSGLYPDGYSTRSTYDLDRICHEDSWICSNPNHLSHRIFWQPKI